MYKIVIEVVTDSNGPAKLISLERFDVSVPDTGAADSFAVVKHNIGERVGNLIAGDRFTVHLVSPSSSINESSVSLTQMVQLAVGATFSAYSVNPNIGFWSYYD